MSIAIDFGIVGEGYAHLASLADLGLVDLEPQSEEAKAALIDHSKRLNAKYSASTGSPSEYAVGFGGSKPAFEGERSEIAKFVALVARSHPYTAEYPFEFMGYGFWTEKGKPLLQIKKVTS